MVGLGQRIRIWGTAALANPGAFLLTFLVGGAFTFGYSYVPLHTVKMQKVERLQRTQLIQEAEIAELGRQVEGLEAAVDGGLDASAATALQAQREEAAEENRLLREEVDRAKQRTKRLERERSEWRRRVSALEKKLETVTTELAERSATPPAPSPTLAGGSVVAPAADVPPSAPAP